MPSFELILKTGCYVLLLFFGTHYIRTWAFRRYEAVTFECSAGAFLISVLLMLRNGFSWPLCALAAALLLAFLANAFCQWHFYMLLQDIIKEHFLDNAGVSDKEAADLKDKANNKKENKEALSFDQQRQHAISNTLYTMASVAIMPSYSRFIEESKLLNNPGGLIGLIKSILKRQRFQKKKYRMRDCFAENVNLIGPCKPRLDTMLRDATKVVAAPIHANDLALDYKEEKIGLVSFDILGFGALAAIWGFLPVYAGSSGSWSSLSLPLRAVLLLGLLLAFTALSSQLRHYAFARYENFWYELSFSALVAVSLRVFANLIADSGVAPIEWLALGVVLLLFLAASFANHHADRKLHDGINKFFDKLIYRIMPDSELNRAKRSFLRNLKTISEWAVVPFSTGKAKTEKTGDGRARDRKPLSQKIRRFRSINKEKENIPDLMASLIRQVEPNYPLNPVPAKKEPSEKPDLLPDDPLEVFSGDQAKQKFMKAIIIAAGVLSATAASCVWAGIAALF